MKKRGSLKRRVRWFAVQDGCRHEGRRPGAALLLAGCLLCSGVWSTAGWARAEAELMPEVLEIEEYADAESGLLPAEGGSVSSVSDGLVPESQTVFREGTDAGKAEPSGVVIEEILPEREQSGREDFPESGNSETEKLPQVTIDGVVPEPEIPGGGQGTEGTGPTGGVEPENPAGQETEVSAERETEGSQGPAGHETEEPEEPAGRETEAPEKPGTIPQENSGKVYLGIDSYHCYDGMEQTFSEGYQPTVEDGVVYLAVPFTSSGRLKYDRLTVSLIFAEKDNAPFVFRNYQKEVEKKRYLEVNGRMTEIRGGMGTLAVVTANGQAAAPGTQPAAADTPPDRGQSKSAEQSKAVGAGSGSPSAAPDGSESNEMETYLYFCEIPLLENALPGQYSVTVRACGYTEQMEQTVLECQVFIRIPEPPAEEPDPGEGEGGASGGGDYGGYSGGGSSLPEVLRQPKMLLESCNLSGKQLEAGSTETLDVSFRNRSDSQSMYNLKIIASSEHEGLTLARNSYYFALVSPEEEIHLDTTLRAVPDAAAGMTTLTFEFEYEDKEGKTASGRETLTLSVVQPTDVELEAAEIPAVVYAADTLELDLKARNLSRTGVYNVRMELAGEGMFPNGEIFLGNMEAGTEDTGTMRVYVGTRTMERVGQDSGSSEQEKYGTVSGTVTLRYEDAGGITHESTREYQTEIKKPKVLTLTVTEEEPEANSWWISVIAMVLAGLLLAVIVLLACLRRKSVLLAEARRAFDSRE